MSASVALTGTGKEPGARSPIPLVVSVLVALLLFAAAGLKVLEWMQAAEGARGARETMGADAAGPPVWKLMIPVAEAFIAAGIVVFHRRAWVWTLASLMFGSMAGYVFLLMVRGEASCGCFGAYSPPPVVMFSVDTILAVVCATLATRWWGFVEKRGLVLTLAGAGSIVGATVANATTEPAVAENFDPMVALRELNVMQPALEVGRNAPVYMIYIYQKECPACQQHYPGMHRFTQATAAHPDIHGLLLEIGDIQEMAESEGKYLHKASWEEVPVTLIMQNGQIRERYGRSNTPSPRAVYERMTGSSYDDLLKEAPESAPLLPLIPGTTGSDLIPTEFGPNADPDAIVNPAADRVVDKSALVSKLRALDRFSEIFDDEPGGVRHLMYAHTMCGSCLDYRKMLLEFEESGIVSDTLAFHPVTRTLLVDDGIADEDWGGVHAALLFDGGVLLQWYGDGEVTDDLPNELYDQFAD